MSYVDAGYSIGLGILFLYAVALVLRRRRWERALQVIERAEPADRIAPAQRPDHASRPRVSRSSSWPNTPSVSRPSTYAEEQTAPGARS